MYKYWTFLFLGLSILPLAQGCTNDAKEKEEATISSQLTKNWVLVEATRNGKKTDTLTDAFIEFRPDNTLTINLTGNPQTGNWELDGHVLTISNTKDTSLSTDYTITEITDTKLVYEMTIRGFAFSMQFVPQETVE